MDYSKAFDDTTAVPTGGIDAFDSAVAAPEFTPLPQAVYTCRVVRGEYCSTNSGAEAYRMRFEVTDGPHAGQTVVRTWTFGPKALQYTKRDLAPFGLNSSAQLRAPFPAAGREYLVRLVVALKRGDDGIERNDVKRVDNVRVVESPAAGFLLDEDEGRPK